MRSLKWGGLALVAALALGWTAAGEITVAGGGKVQVPAEGFVWTKLKEEGKVETFRARRPGIASETVMLIVEQATMDSDARKVAQVKGEFNGMLTTMKEMGFTDIKGTKPNLTPPLGKVVRFTLSGVREEGKRVYFEAALVFGKSTYHFQAMSESAEGAKTLAQVADGVKE